MFLFSHARSTSRFPVRGHPTSLTLVCHGLGPVLLGGTGIRTGRVRVPVRGQAPEEGKDVVVFEKTAFENREWYWGGGHRPHHGQETALGREGVGRGKGKSRGEVERYISTGKPTGVGPTPDKR